MPKKGPASKIIGWIIPVLIVGLIAYGFLTNTETGLRQLTAWILWNGALAAAFTALALGHPLSILTAFVVAPISSLNPMLACGWFAGLVEAAIRKPTMGDVDNVPTIYFASRAFLKTGFYGYC